MCAAITQHEAAALAQAHIRIQVPVQEAVLRQIPHSENQFLLHHTRHRQGEVQAQVQQAEEVIHQAHIAGHLHLTADLRLPTADHHHRTADLLHHITAGHREAHIHQDLLHRVHLQDHQAAAVLHALREEGANLK